MDSIQTTANKSQWVQKLETMLSLNPSKTVIINPQKDGT